MSLEILKARLGLGARANKYLITMNYADAVSVDALAKAATLPDATMGTVEVWNKGRKLMVAGDAAYSNTWDVTFYNDELLTLKKIFETEMTRIDSFDVDTRSVITNAEYMTDITVSQLSATNIPTATYQLRNAFPTAISAVDLADDAADTISELTVTFTYSHWVRVF